MLCTETKMASDKFLNELVNFLGDPLFQIPLRTFMDEHCLIFDPTVSPTEDHTQVHERYKKLVAALLEGFCQDTGTTADKAVKEFNTMYEKNDDLKEFFEVLHDQLMASTDFEVFYGAMAKRNIVIQQQVLVMIMASTGALPASFSLDESPPKEKKGNDLVSAVSDDKQEEDILKKVMKASEEEHNKLQKQQQEEQEALRKTLELSKSEAQALQSQRKQIEQQLEKMTLEAPPVTTAPIVGREMRPKKAEPAKKAPGPLRAPPPAAAAAAAAPAVSGSDAANAWLQSAQQEAAAPSAAHAAVAEKMANMTAEEIKQRQAFLNTQRDKLIAMKKKKREEQLKDSVKQQPKRPASARAARDAMAQSDQVNEDDEKKLAMRRAIADKLRQEVIGK